MIILQKLDSQVVKQLIELNKDFVRRRFTEKRAGDRRMGGAPRLVKGG